MQPLNQDRDNQPFLQDSFARRINYLRLAVTDRCNLTCHYCRPSNTTSSKAALLSYDELLRLVRIFAALGINNLSITTNGTPLGMMKTCLYGKEVLDLKKMLCDDYSDKALAWAIHDTVQHKAASGTEADNGAQTRCSMALIGG